MQIRMDIWPSDESLSEFVQKDPVAGGALILPKRRTVASRTFDYMLPSAFIISVAASPS
jgi:hypothetical protein